MQKYARVGYIFYEKKKIQSNEKQKINVALISGRFIFASTLILTGYLMVDVGDMVHYIFYHLMQNDQYHKRTCFCRTSFNILFALQFVYADGEKYGRLTQKKGDSLANRRSEIEIYPPPFVNVSISRFDFLLTTPHKHANSYLFSGIKILWNIFLRCVSNYITMFAMHCM